MKTKITNIQLKFACQADWGNMQQAEGGRFCTACQKTVYDFTDARQQEFLQILAEQNGNICGRFRIDQLTPVHTPIWKKWVTAALVLVGINIFTHKAEAQGMPIAPKLQQKPVIKEITTGAPVPIYKRTINYSEYFTVSDCDVVPEFPGGHAAFIKFIAKQIHYGRDIENGKNCFTFIINKDGSLSDFALVRGLSRANDAETIRVLKQSPKWRPGMINNQPVKVRYTVLINFQKPKPAQSSSHPRG